MLQLKTLLRRLLARRLYTIFSTVGLVTGISAFLVLFIFVLNERSYDRHIPSAGRIFRVHTVPDGIDQAPWARSLAQVYTAALSLPGVEEATRFTHCTGGRIRIGDRTIVQDHILSVDTGFAELFDVEVLVGDFSELSRPNVLFVSEEFAERYFPGEDPVGREIQIDALQYSRDLGRYEIMGIVGNTPPRQHLHYEVLISQKGALEERFQHAEQAKIQWTYTYLKLGNGIPPATIADGLKSYYDQSELKAQRGPGEYSISLFPLLDIYLHSDARFELKEGASELNLSLLFAVSIIILLVSLLNYINLSAAVILKRSREFGLRKVLGAGNPGLIWLVLGEITLLCLFSLGLSILLLEVVKPLLGRLFGIAFRIHYSDPAVLLSFGFVLFIVLALSGLFFGFFLFSRNRVLDILTDRPELSGQLIFRSLLILQLMVVLGLFSSTFLVNKQVHYMLDRPLGFEAEGIVVLRVKDFSRDPAVFVHELERHSQISSVGMTLQHFGYPAQSFQLGGLGIEGSAELVFANYAYLKTMGIKLLHNWINPDADTVRGMIINRHLYDRLIERHGSMDALMSFHQQQELGDGQVHIHFIGVAEDFSFASAREHIGDFAFLLDESANRSRFMHVRLEAGALHKGMDIIRESWEEYYPDQELDYFFLDDRIAQQYTGEMLLKNVLLCFSILAILICLIGMSAMALFMARHRSREIGIRKVNGSGIAGILLLLSKRFILWLGLAFVLATPLSYFLLKRWLLNFAFQTALSWWIFALSGLLTLLVSLFTVWIQSYRIAARNPVQALREE